MESFSQRVSPPALFYRGLGFGFLGAGLLWVLLAALVYQFV
jgi:hypothetical protein